MPLFDGMPNEIGFPWDGVDHHPPAEGPEVDQAATCTWARPRTTPTATGSSSTTLAAPTCGVPIKMAQAGQIRLLQVAAYDADGNVLKVPFHISFYYVGRGQRAVDAADPGRAGGRCSRRTPPASATRSCATASRRSRSTAPRSTRTSRSRPRASACIRAYGTFYEKAGFWPGCLRRGRRADRAAGRREPWDVRRHQRRRLLLGPVPRRAQPDSNPLAGQDLRDDLLRRPGDQRRLLRRPDVPGRARTGRLT